MGRHRVTIQFCPHFIFLLPYFFSSHVTSSVTLPSHVTYVTWSVTWSVTWPFITWPPYCSNRSLFYCLDRLLFTFSIVPVLLSLTPLFSKAIVRLLRMLSQVAASVVYKLACIIERGLKPDLVFQSKCCCSSKPFFCVPLPSISFPFGSSQILETHPSFSFTARRPSWVNSSKHYRHH